MKSYAVRQRSFLPYIPSFARRCPSQIFPQIRDQARLKVDEEELYIIMGDALGDEEDLYLEALIRGAARQGDLNRALFEELDNHLKHMISRRNVGSGGYSNPINNPGFLIARVPIVQVRD